MLSRTLLENYGLNTGDLVELLVMSLSELTLTDLQYILMQIELETEYRADTGQI